jgi:hypothetical protein
MTIEIITLRKQKDSETEYALLDLKKKAKLSQLGSVVLFLLPLLIENGTM